MSVRRIARDGALLALACVLFLTAGPAWAAPVEEVLLPLDRYNTEKSRALASQYRPQLVSVLRAHLALHPVGGLAEERHRVPHAAVGDRGRPLLLHLDLIDQTTRARFSALSQERRDSAMLSRYGVDLLRRMIALGGLASDSQSAGLLGGPELDQAGDARAPRSTARQRDAGAFTDRATVLEYLASRLPGAEFLAGPGARCSTARQDLGRPPPGDLGRRLRRDLQAPELRAPQERPLLLR